MGDSRPEGRQSATPCIDGAAHLNMDVMATALDLGRQLAALYRALRVQNQALEQAKREILDSRRRAA